MNEYEYSSTSPFEPFPKIARLNREVIVTEKIDGTNAVIHVSDDGIVRAGSRTKWITPETDNHGFARWAGAHQDELRVGLGPGAHFGEWWGAGIQRRYGLTEKRFSLFNTARWRADTLPACCSVVPVLAIGIGVDEIVRAALDMLRRIGSLAAPGFMDPEGVVVFHAASSALFKVTLKGDDAPKGAT